VTVVLLAALAGCSFRARADLAPDGDPVGSTGPVAGADGPPSAPGSPAPPVTVTSGAPPRAAECTTDQLVAALLPGAVTASRAEAVLTVTNISRSTCAVHGYGGLSLKRSDGRTVPSRQVRTAGAVATVLLVSGASARSTVSWARAGNPAVGEPATGDCEPTPTSLQVIPPDQTTALAVPWDGGPVCEQGTLTSSPYRASG
jgi:Protein of unknown function (DUF4232)